MSTQIDETVDKSKIESPSIDTNAAEPSTTAPATTPAVVSQPGIISPSINSKEQFEAFCKQYAAYIQYSTLIGKEVEGVSEIISGLISRTDESGLLMDPLGTKTANRAEQIIPILKERAASLRTTFLTIDKLKELIEKIKLNVLEAEKLVNEAEEANSTISMTKLFSVFSSKKDKPKTDRPSGSLKVIDTRSEFDAMRKEVNAAISK